MGAVGTEVDVALGTGSALHLQGQGCILHGAWKWWGLWASREAASRQPCAGLQSGRTSHAPRAVPSVRQRAAYCGHQHVWPAAADLAAPFSMPGH